MTVLFDTLSTPLGPFSVAVGPHGEVLASAFGGRDVLLTRRRDLALPERPTALPALRRQLSEYFEGRRTRFDLTYAPVGTPFQQKIWALLLGIPFGQPRSYGDLARDAGSPSAARAVGAANGANPICVFIPCHRVIGANGTLTGFAFGEERKRRLLALEGAWELPGLVAPAAAS